MSLGDVISAGGQVIQDLFQSEGSSAEANSFTSAAQLAGQNAQLASASTRIQATQTARQIYQTEGTQQADVASAGFTESGSALDLLRSSAQQGALAKSLVNIQGAIQENSYAAQQGAYLGAAKASNESADANTIGAIASLGGALVKNSTDLLSAGKTVVQGINSIFGGESAADTVDGALSSDLVQNAFASNPADLSVFGSETDFALDGGADLSTSLAASDIGLDTSEIAIGTETSAAETGLDTAISSISDSVGGALSDVAESLGLDGLGDLGLDIGLGPIGLIAGVASFIPGVGDVINSVVGGVESAVSDVFSGIGSVFGSVICTAYYKLGFIRYRTWVGDQKYGTVCNATVFRGYYKWGVPVANCITNHPTLALLLFPVFKLTICEMAARCGVGKSTLLGSISLGFFSAFSYCVGLFVQPLENISNARKT